MDGLIFSHIVAAGGGLISFLSPCVLPLVPAYLCFVAGVTMEEMERSGQTNGGALSLQGAGRGSDRLSILSGAVCFVLGFSTVFIILGATAAAMNPYILAHKIWLEKVAGGVIILFGLHMTGVFRIGFLNRDVRFNRTHTHRPGEGGPHAHIMRNAGAYVLGLAFAFGWTPCIGPILATVLTVAAGQDSLPRGISLLTAYSFGLGLPFIAAALGIGSFFRFSRRFRRHLRALEIATGSLLAVTGVLIATGTLERLAWYLLEYLPVLGRLG